MMVKKILGPRIVDLSFGLFLTGMAMSGASVSLFPTSPVSAEPVNPLNSISEQLPLPTPRSNGDYPRSLHQNWQVTPPNTQGVECRMLGNTTYEQLADPGNKQRLNIGNWPIVGRFQPGQTFDSELGPAGFGVVYDTKRQPWIYVEKTDDQGAPSQCFIRANQRFVQPIR